MGQQKKRLLVFSGAPTTHQVFGRGAVPGRGQRALRPLQLRVAVLQEAQVVLEVGRQLGQLLLQQGDLAL